MKSFRYIFVSALALAALAACTNVEVYNVYPEYGDVNSDYNASISSASSAFTANDEGGAIKFTSAGGEVVINVDSPSEWTVENTGSGWLDAVANCQYGTLTVSAGQNTETSQKTATLVLSTVSGGTAFATVTVTQNAYGTPDIFVGTGDYNFPAVGALTAEIEVVTASDYWEVETSCSWLYAEKTTEGTLLLKADVNPSTEPRSTEVTLTSENGSDADSETITVTQDGKAYVELDSDVLYFYSDGSARSASVAIESNFDWDFTYDTSNGWFTVSRDGDILTATVTSENTGEDNREGAVTVTATDGAENIAEYIFNVVQYGSNEQGTIMMLVYTLSSSGTIMLPCSGTVDCAVDWGDGSDLEQVTSTFPTHTYESGGEYTVSIAGTVTTFNSKNIANNIIAMLTGIKQWGDIGLTSMNYAFYYYPNLTSIPADTAGGLSEVTAMNYAFTNCTALTEISPDFLKYATSLETLTNTFQSCSALTSIPEGLFDNCANLQSLLQTFQSCSGLTSLKAGQFKNCTNLTSFQHCFDGCSALTELPEGLFEGCEAVTTFLYVFQNCTGLTGLPEDLFSYSPHVVYFGYAFDGCTKLQTIPAKLFANNSEATSFTYTFYKCSALESIPEGLFANCPLVTTFAYTFYYCSTLETVPADLFSYCPEVTTFASVFYYCKGLKTLPEGLFANNPKVTTFLNAFYNCTSLEALPDGLFSNNPLVTTFGSLCRSCSALTSIPEDLFANCPEVTTFTYAFYSCSKLASNIEKLFENNRLVTVFSYTFYGCTALTCESPYNIIEEDGEEVKVHLYERTNYSSTDYFGGISKITSTSCFKNCKSLTDYSSIASGWY